MIAVAASIVVGAVRMMTPHTVVLCRDGFYQSLGDRVHDHVDDAARAAAHLGAG